jgi:hypothetical protein
VHAVGDLHVPTSVHVILGQPACPGLSRRDALTRQP